MSKKTCVIQLLSIVHEISESFDNFPSLEMRSEFLDMSKAFDKVWHEGLIYKLKAIGVSNNLLTLFQSFLDNRYQRVCKSTDWLLYTLVDKGLRFPLKKPIMICRESQNGHINGK